MIAVANSPFPRIMKAYRALPRRDGDDLKAGVVIARVSKDGAVEAAQAELAEIHRRSTQP